MNTLIILLIEYNYYIEILAYLSVEMSNVGKYIERNPGQTAAGLVTTVPHESAFNCIQPTDQVPQTPPGIKKYRKSFNADPGAKQIHYGTVEDPLPPTTFTYGKKTYKSDHVHQVIGHQNLSGLAEFANKVKEDKYASAKREPLGTTMSRGYEFPAQTQSSDFRFGQPTPESESAKNLLFPSGGSLVDNEQVAKMYFKSHGLTEAGEQIKREYQWQVDPEKHRFGMPDPKQLNGAAQALHPERYETTFPKTTIVKKTVEDFRSTANDELGRPRNLGQTNGPVPHDFAFGKSTVSKDPWNAAKCIHGQPTEKELQPDKDLGRTNKFGFRNVPRPGDEDRVFGVPTIRKDINKKELKSVADHQNYGDEVGANKLIYPDFWLRHGLDPEDFNTERPKEDIRGIFEAIGEPLKVGKFEAIYNKALELYGVVSLSTFIQAMRWFEANGIK